MGIQERKQREREQRRELIIEAASQVFMKKGLNAATMEEIAATAELSKATLYLYFTNKEELFLAVLLIVMDNFAKVMSEALDESMSCREQILKMGECYLEFYYKYPAYYKLLNTMDLTDDFNYAKYELSNSLVEANTRIWEIVCSPIIKGMKDGTFKADLNPLEIGLILWTSSTGIMNLMEHIQQSPHHNDQCAKLPSDSSVSQFTKVDYKKMLESTWLSLVNYIQK